MTRGGCRIRFSPVAYGYGPIGKALHVARALRARLRDDAQLELVAPSNFQVTAEPGLFDRISPHRTENADVVVSFMNRAAAEEAHARGEHVVFVDSLAWLWDAGLPVHHSVDLYLYQELPFLPVPERNVQAFSETAPVGAIVGPLPVPRAGRSGVVVSLAGLENFEVSVGRGNLYYPAVVGRALAGLGGHPRITIFGNPTALRTAGLPEERCHLSGRQSDFLLSAVSADRVLLSPGLTTICELLAASVPIALLPPQNYSQVRIAAALRRAAPAIPQVLWASEALDWLADHEVPERVGSQMVRNVICERWLDPSGLCADDLLHLLNSPLVCPTPDAVDTLIGPRSGADDVAAHIAARL